MFVLLFCFGFIPFPFFFSPVFFCSACLLLLPTWEDFPETEQDVLGDHGKGRTHPWMINSDTASQVVLNAVGTLAHAIAWVWEGNSCQDSVGGPPLPFCPWALALACPPPVGQEQQELGFQCRFAVLSPQTEGQMTAGKCVLLLLAMLWGLYRCLYGPRVVLVRMLKASTPMVLFFLCCLIHCWRCLSPSPQMPCLPVGRSSACAISGCLIFCCDSPTWMHSL